jgi:branched-chain amino acid transport system substrate-binding protein
MKRRLFRSLMVGGMTLAGALVPVHAQTGRLIGKEIRIGAIVPSTGPFAEWGRSNAATLRMIEDQVNGAGGVEGARLRIIVYDDGAKPAQAALLVRKLADDDQVQAIAGPLTSSAAEVAFPVANKVGVVATSQASAKPAVAANNRPWAFRNTIDEAILAEAATPSFKKAFNVRTIAIIYDAKDANSVALGSKIMPGVLAKNDIKLVNAASLATFNTGDLDVSAQVTALKGLGPDALVVAADYSQAITIMREMKRQDFVRPIIGGTPLISTAILKASPEQPVVAPASFYVGETGEAAEKFAASLGPLLRREPGLTADVTPSMYDANIYEIVELYLEAIRKGGVTADSSDLAKDRERIRDYLARVKGFQGLAGPMGFNATGDAAKTFFVLLGKDGAWTPIAKGCSATDGAGC